MIKPTRSNDLRKLLLLLLALTLSLTGWSSVDTRIFDGSAHQRTEAEEGEQGEIDPNARTGWQRDQDEKPTEDGEKKPEPPKPSALPQPPDPEARRGLPEPPDPSQKSKAEEGAEEREKPPPGDGRPSPGVRASPQLQGISLDIALPFPSDI